AAIVARHADHRPGARPFLWWKFNAPEPRKRLGGAGDPLFQCSAHAEEYIWGVPRYWRTDGNSYITRGTPISDSDPPCFESSAAYLRRLQLFLPGEKRRIVRSEFEPNFVRYRRDSEQIALCRS